MISIHDVQTFRPETWVTIIFVGYEYEIKSNKMKIEVNYKLRKCYCKSEATNHTEHIESVILFYSLMFRAPFHEYIYSIGISGT